MTDAPPAAGTPPAPPATDMAATYAAYLRLRGCEARAEGKPRQTSLDRPTDAAAWLAGWDEADAAIDAVLDHLRSQWLASP